MEGWNKIPLEARVTVIVLLGVFFVWAPFWHFWGLGWAVREFGVMVAVYGIPVLISPISFLVIWLFWRGRGHV